MVVSRSSSYAPSDEAHTTYIYTSSSLDSRRLILLGPYPFPRTDLDFSFQFVGTNGCLLTDDRMRLEQQKNDFLDLAVEPWPKNRDNWSVPEATADLMPLFSTTGLFSVARQKGGEKGLYDSKQIAPRRQVHVRLVHRRYPKAIQSRFFVVWAQIHSI